MKSPIASYLYIVGRGRSGTTLLNTLLGNHSDVCAIGELSNLSLQCYRDESTKWLGLCGCGKRPFDCEFWREILTEIEKNSGKNLVKSPFAWRISDVGLEEEYRQLAPLKAPFVWLRHRCWRALRHHQYFHDEAFSRFTKAYTPQITWIKNRDFVLNTISRISRRPVIVDISKDYLGMMDIVNYSQLPTKVLFITRDCRGNVWSKLRGKTEKARDLKLTSQIANDWVRVNQRILNSLAYMHDDKWMHIRYEDLCRAPKETMTKIRHFLSLSDNCDVLTLDSDITHTIAGNKIRFAGQTREIKEDLSWRENLSSKELEEIQNISSSLATKLGYSRY